MSDTDSDIQTMIEDYKKRVEKLKKQRKTIYVVSIPLLIAICIYFSLGYAKFREITSPRKLVTIGYMKTIKFSPIVAKQLEIYLIQAAPYLVDQAFENLLKQLSIWRIRSQDYLNHKITLSLETFETVLPLVLEDIIERHQQTILEIVGLLDDPVQIDLLTIQIEADILSRFDPQLNGLINNMAVFLIDIDKELTMLLSTPTSRLSPMQQENLKLLELWNKTLQKKKFIESPY